MSGKKLKAKDKAVPKAARFSLFQAAVFFAAAVLACGILFWGRSQEFDHQEFILDEPAMNSYFSPLALSYVDESKTASLRAEEVKNVPPVYRVDAGVNKQLIERAELFFRTLDENLKTPADGVETRWKELPFQIPDSSLKALGEGQMLEDVRQNSLTLLGNYLSRGILSVSERSALRQADHQKILIAGEGVSSETPMELENVLTKEAVLAEASEKLPPEVRKNRSARNIILQVLDAAVFENLVPDTERTETLRKKAAEAVKPFEIQIKKNELIVQRGMLVTAGIKDRLDQIQAKLVSRQQRTQILAGALLVLFLYVLTYFYFALFETKTLGMRPKLLLFHTVILLNVLLCKAWTLWPGGSVYWMPTALAALLLTLLISSRSGLWSGAMMAVLGGFLTGFRTDIMLSTLLSSAVATLLTYRVRKRVHFLRVGFGIAGTCFLVLWGFQVSQNIRPAEALPVAALGFGNGLFTVVFAFLLLPLLEMVFDVVTDITLLEHSDLNHPLMRKMMVRAPGTYHHSLVLSSLAEHACERIGANALLAKVGCYFHDIGKIERPEYFSENQGYLYPNLHEQLLPQMSYEIIVDHVRKGVQLGRKHKLKQAILDFITEHQGTGVIYYFYKKAMDQAAPHEHVRADDFRYPGPKPQSKETGVVLLADSVEAASRSLKEATPDAVRQLVRKIINDKFIDGQLDECELTLVDLHRIQESFVQNLSAMFHTRMKYPSVESIAGAVDLFEENQFAKFRIDKKQ